MKMFSQSGTWICEAQRRGLLRATFLSSWTHDEPKPLGLEVV